MTGNDSIVIPPRAIDLAGQQFGRLAVIRYTGHDQSGRIQWLCKCDCGKKYTVTAKSLRDGHTRSCGCLQREETITRFTTHGMRKTPEYEVWCQMLKRCYNTNRNGYHRYGGRGITVCQRWRESFAAFFQDMGPRPSSGYSLDRYPNNDGNYEKGNCRWATQSQQARNRCNNRLLTFRGKTQVLAAWGKELGMKQYVLNSRIQHGWTIERAFTQPVRHQRCLPKGITSTKTDS